MFVDGGEIDYLAAACHVARFSLLAMKEGVECDELVGRNNEIGRMYMGATPPQFLHFAVAAFRKSI